MRLLCLLAFLLLAPLCGWATDAPPHAGLHADCMGHHAVQSTVQQPATAHAPAATFSLAPASTAQQANAMAPQGTHCTACATCLSVALPAIELRVGVQAMPHSLPRADGAVFSSAELRTGHKPPIS